MNLAQVLDSVAASMRADFRLTAELQHSQSKGHVREALTVRDFLLKYMPRSVEIVQSGEIIATDGTVSPECDVLFLDPVTPPFWERDTGYRVVPVECVHGIVEVKSHLDSRELKKAIENVAKIKKMPKTAYHPQVGAIRNSTTIYGREWPHFPLFAIVFAFKSVDLRTLAATLVEAQQQHEPEHRIDGVFVLDRGMMVYPTPAGLLDLGQAARGLELLVFESDNPLLTMTVMLQQRLQQAWMPRFKIQDYLMGIAFGQVLTHIRAP